MRRSKGPTHRSRLGLPRPSAPEPHRLARGRPGRPMRKTLKLPARQARFVAKSCEHQSGTYAGHVSTTWKWTASTSSISPSTAKRSRKPRSAGVLSDKSPAAVLAAPRPLPLRWTPSAASGVACAPHGAAPERCGSTPRSEDGFCYRNRLSRQSFNALAWSWTCFWAPSLVQDGQRNPNPPRPVRRCRPGRDLAAALERERCCPRSRFGTGSALCRGGCEP